MDYNPKRVPTSVSTLPSLDDHLASAFAVNVAKTQSEKEAVYALRYKVYIEEMDKPYENADHVNKRLYDRLDETATLLYVTEQSEIVGTVRINWGRDAHTLQSYAQVFLLHLFQEYLPESFSFCSRLAVAANWRKSLVTVSLFEAAYFLGREESVLFNFISCSPHLVKLFKHFGFRRYSENFDDADVGVQVPMVLLLEDSEHLHASRSPFFKDARIRENRSMPTVWFNEMFTGENYG